MNAVVLALTLPNRRKFGAVWSDQPVVVTDDDLRRFRRRIALVNKRAGYHQLALQRAMRGTDPLHDCAWWRATADERREGIGWGTYWERWINASEFAEAMSRGERKEVWHP